MKTVHRLFFPLVMLFSLFVFATAFADAGTVVTSAPVQLPSGWAGFAMLVVIFIAWLTRKLTNAKTGKVAAFIHSTSGAAISGFIAAVTPGLIQALQHGWNLQALEAALIGGGLTYFAVDNASNSGSEQKAKVLAMKSSGAGGLPPTINKVSAYVPLVFSLALFSFIGCVHVTPSEKAFGQAFASCMELRGLAAAPDVGKEVWNDLTTGSNPTIIKGQLEALAGRAGVDAVTCAVQSWLGSGLGEKNPAGVTAAKDFLKAHGS